MLETQAQRQEIEAVDREFEAAFGRGDAGAVAALYTEDARLLPPGSPAVSGREAIQRFWTGARETGVRTVALMTQHVEASDDLAYEIGIATLTIAPPGAAPITDTAKYLVVWKRRADGRWQLAADIWNSGTGG